MQTRHHAFDPTLSPHDQRAERHIAAVQHVSEQIEALSLEQALIEIRANTAAVTANTAALAAIQENTRPFANLRFLFRKFRSFSGRVLRGAVDGLVNSLPR